MEQTALCGGEMTVDQNTHQDHYVSRRGEAMNMHMRPESFRAESAAFILVCNEYRPGGFEREDADEWHRRAKGIVFW